MALNPYDTPRGRLHARIETSRRQFLVLVGAVGALGASVLGGMELLKFMFPAATLEAPPTFKTNFTVADLTGHGTLKNNVISDTANRVTVVLDAFGIYAVYLVCTHLGCTPNYVTDVTTGTGVNTAAPSVDEHYTGEPNKQSFNGWACPCHGSRYFIDSTNFYGPAPRPMDWVDISITPDNYFSIDRGTFPVSRGAGDTKVPGWRLDPATGKNNGMTI
ncbi:MAG: QcrA and Rieske domain-containing protein [Candidatus Dormibacteria bacterium]